MLLRILLEKIPAQHQHLGTLACYGSRPVAVWFYYRGPAHRIAGVTDDVGRSLPLHLGSHLLVLGDLVPRLAERQLDLAFDEHVEECRGLTLHDDAIPRFEHRRPGAAREVLYVLWIQPLEERRVAQKIQLLARPATHSSPGLVEDSKKVTAPSSRLSMAAATFFRIRYPRYGSFSMISSNVSRGILITSVVSSQRIEEV